MKKEFTKTIFEKLSLTLNDDFKIVNGLGGDIIIHFPKITSNIKIRICVCNYGMPDGTNSYSVGVSLHNLHKVADIDNTLIDTCRIKITENENIWIDNIKNILVSFKEKMERYIDFIQAFNDSFDETHDSLSCRSMINTVNMTAYFHGPNNNFAYIKPIFNLKDSYTTLEVGNGVVPPMTFYTSISFDDLKHAINFLIGC